MPLAECQVSFWVEKPLRPQWARMEGREAGNPKQSGSMKSELSVPNSRLKKVWPTRSWRMMDSEAGTLTSDSSQALEDGHHWPLAT